MSIKSGLTERTVKHLQLGAGILVKNYTAGTALSQDNIICATRGGGTIDIKAIIHQVAIDGAPTYTKGLERVNEHQASLKFTTVEFTSDNIVRAVAGAQKKTSEGGDTTITAIREILATGYEDVTWLGDTSNGKNCVIKLKNAMNLDGLSISANDKNEGTYALNMIAHYDPADLDTAPFEIIVEGDND